MIFLLMVQFAFNTFTPDTSGIQTAINGALCPMPEFDGYPFNNRTYNTVSAGNTTKVLTCTSYGTPNGKDYAYGEPTINLGFFYFVGDWIAEGAVKIGYSLYTVGLYLFPVTGILGIIPDVIVGLITTVIGFLYVMLVIGIYKTFVPFVSG